MRELPVRIKQTVDREHAVFTNSRGYLVGWELDDLDVARLQHNSDSAVKLERMPKHLFVRIRNGGGEEHATSLRPHMPNLEEGVYPLKPAWCTWAREKQAH